MNILLVNCFDEGQNRILPEVAKELRGMGARARVVNDVRPSLKHWLWTLGKPTYVIGLRPIKRFLPSWAQGILQHTRYPKIQEGAKLEAAGMPMPKWTAFGEKDTPDLKDFSEFVVVKPAAGARGAYVRIMRKGRVHWRPLEIKSQQMMNDALIVQEYIHTGPWPVSYRVGTIFGEPIYKLKITADQKRPPIDYQYHSSNGEKKVNQDLKATSQGFGGKAIVASSKGCGMSEEVPEEILHFATEIHEKAFPDVPFIAVDVLKDHSTGKLYMLEANTDSWSFIITSETGERIKKEFGIDCMKQFGGAKAIARGILKRLQSPKGAALQESVEEKDFVCQTS